MFSLLFLFSAVAPHFVNAQLVQSNATCLLDYSWMGNSKNASPCMVAAALDAQCNGGHWDIIALNGSNRYTNPAGLLATLCTCSWASYNLISACTACQGYQSSMAVWGDYISGCAGNTTNNTYWPPAIPIPTDVRIPYWASTNPTTWTGQIFSLSDAKTIYLASHPDLPATTATSQDTPESMPVGAIVGGVIGGLVVICLFIAIFICLIRKNRKAMNGAANPDERMAHMRKISDTTVTSNNTTFADSSSTRPMLRTPSTNMQRSTSISSLPFFSSLLGRDSRAAGAQTPGPQQPNIPPLSEFITPFTLPPTNDVPEKKITDGEWPAFDQPSAPPQNTVQMAVFPSQTPPRKTGTIRYNPPTYSESITTPTVSRHQPQDSTDSSLSTPLATEASDGTARRAFHTPANSGSSMGHMGVSNPRASTSTFQTMQTSLSTTRTSVGQVSMARGYGRSLFRPRSRETMTEESFSPSEIA